MWSIAAAHLGPQATVSSIDAEWHRIYAANSAVIGSNPDLLRPGQVLTIPT